MGRRKSDPFMPFMDRARGMVTLHFENDLAATLEPLCQRVIEHFQPPDLRLLCFFDDKNPSCFDQRFNGKYRGFHTPVKGSGYMPPHIQRHFLETSFAFDNLIYLRGTTCATEVGALITFAHELQHFVQQGGSFKVSVANGLLYDHLHNLDPANTAKAWNIPHEHDAMMVSKRVAEAVVGTEVVSKHAASRIAAEDDALYWKYFESLSTEIPFDLLVETIPWVDKYRSQLRALAQTKIDFSQSEWWR
jgi:hypothetical protein